MSEKNTEKTYTAAEMDAAYDKGHKDAKPFRLGIQERELVRAMTNSAEIDRVHMRVMEEISKGGCCRLPNMPMKLCDEMGVSLQSKLYLVIGYALEVQEKINQEN